MKTLANLINSLFVALVGIPYLIITLVLGALVCVVAVPLVLVLVVIEGLWDWYRANNG